MISKGNGIFLRLSKDFALNIAASFLSTGVMQLLLYPKLASFLGRDEYGLMLTVAGYINIITLSFGNNLCNARLIINERYRQKGIWGDFQILLVIGLVAAAALFSFCGYLLHLPGKLFLSALVMVLLSICMNYYLVAFRLKLDYVGNLFANLFVCIGLVVGVFVFMKLLPWPWIFSCSYVFGLWIIWRNSDIIREPFTRTELFAVSANRAGVLLASGLIGNMTTYLDRFLIHPILGAGSVSIYATAVWFSKSIFLVLTPMNSVLLSYLAGEQIRITKKRFLSVCGMLLVAAAFFELAVRTVGMWITGILYPGLIEEAAPYMMIASSGIIMGIISNFFGTIVLAYGRIYWQTVFSVLNIVSYGVLGIVLLNKYGLRGMCIAVLVTNVTMAAVQFGISYVLIEKRNCQIEGND